MNFFYRHKGFTNGDRNSKNSYDVWNLLYAQSENTKFHRFLHRFSTKCYPMPVHCLRRKGDTRILLFLVRFLMEHAGLYMSANVMKTVLYNQHYTANETGKQHYLVESKLSDKIANVRITISIPNFYKTEMNRIHFMLLC